MPSFASNCFYRFATVTLLVCAGCGSTSTPATTAAKTITVTETEYSIALSPSVIAAGDIVFASHNGGALEHEMVVFKTDLAPDKMPVKADGTVDENGAGVTHIDPEIPEFGGGTSASATLHLAAGKYVVLCNVGNHYSKGMRTALTVQ